METAAPGKSRITLALIITAAAVTVLTVILILVSLPHFGGEQDSLASVPQTEAPTLAPTEPPTEPEPTEPPADPNPYGPLDFQYKNNYLTCLAGESLTGIDVSSWQKDIDWEQVAASGVDFAMIRIGYRGYGSGALGIDKYAYANLDGALAAGLQVGVYFFSQALTREEAEEEAYYVLSAIEGYDITMPVVFDWEPVDTEGARSKEMDRRTLTDCALTFLETIEAAGYWPMIYFNRNQAKYDLYLAELNEYDFWLAMYSDRMTFPYKLKMWQYTNTGKVPGIEGHTDINVFFVDT